MCFFYHNRHKNLVFSPKFLKSKGIPFTRVIQEQHTFVITFSYGYHAGFSHGLNLGEASNCVGDAVSQLQFSKHCGPHMCDEGAMQLSICKMVRKYEGEQVYQDYVEGMDFFCFDWVL